MKLRALACLAFCGVGFSQVAGEANKGYQTPEGRSSVAAALSAKDRDAKQQPRKLVQTLGIKPGMTVADIGTGVGYMLPFLSDAVGSQGRVLAEDIYDDFLDTAGKRVHLANVTFIQGSETDPRLPEGSVDVALALDSWHHWNYPDKMLAAIRRALRSDGRLAIVDYYKRPGAMPGGSAPRHIRLDEADVIREIEASGFRLLSRGEHIPNSQYVAIFGRN